MRKKFLAFMLATSMVLTAAPAAANLGTAVASAEEAVVATNEAAAEVETIGLTDKTTPWWSAFSKNHYKLSGDFDVTFTFNNYSDGTENWRNYILAFTNENAVKDGTQSADYKEFAILRADSFGWGSGNKGDNKTFSGNDIAYESTLNGDWDTFKEIMQSAKVDMNVKRSGADVTIAAHIVSLKDETKAYDYTVKFTETTDDMYLTFSVEGGYLELLSATGTFEGAVPVKDTSNFASITTQPVVKYTFDNADGIELAGDAAVEDGVLKLAKDATSNQGTYAKIADLTSYDFSKGITLAADVNVAAYASDWTPIFMLGDGELGKDAADATGVYHFSQGFSSVGGVNGSYFDGYFGNEIAQPYTWDYFSKEENRNKWYKLAVTVTPTAMATYMDGVKVQEKTGDYANIFSALKVASKNYLGTSYWAADIDFAGSLDNVGIYNEALSAADVAALAGVTPAAPSDDNKTTTDDSKTTAAKKKMTVKVTAKTGAKKVTGTVSVAKATVKVKVGSAAYKKATVKGKKFTLKTSKLKKGTKVVVKVTKSGYKTVTKNVKVK